MIATAPPEDDRRFMASVSLVLFRFLFCFSRLWVRVFLLFLYGGAD